MDEEYGTVNWDIYMYDFSTKTETRITTNGKAFYPSIYGDTIVWYDSQWKDGPNGQETDDIYMCNLNSIL